MFAVKAKIYRVLYKQSSSIAFDELSSYIGQHQTDPNFLAFHWSRLSDFLWSAFRNREGGTFTEKDQNKLNYRIGPKRT